MTLTDPYAAEQRAKRMKRDISSLRDTTKRNQDLHFHPVGEYSPEGHNCPGCALADRLHQILVEGCRS